MSISPTPPAGAIETLIGRRMPALTVPAFRRFWIACIGYDSGYQLMVLAQGWLVFELTGSAMQLGFLGAAVALPNISMTLLGGVFADRFGKRLILLVTAMITALLLLTLAILDITGHIAVWHVLTITALISLASGLNWPAQVSILPELVPRSMMVNAVALNAVVWQSMRMLIPALGGLLLLLTDTWLLFLLAGIGGLGMFFLLLGLPSHTPEQVAESPLQQLVQGLQYVWNRPLFRWIIVLTFTGTFFSQSYVVIAPLLADLMGTGEAGFGLLISASGVGSVAGTLLMGSWSEHRRLGLVMLGGGVLSALALIVFALLSLIPAFWLALVLLALSALFASVFMVGSMSVLQLSVADNFRGRVMGLHTIGFSLPPLGGLWLGSTASWLAEPGGLDMGLGTAAALCLGAAIYIAVITWIFFASPVLRGVNGATLSSDQPANKNI